MKSKVLLSIILIFSWGLCSLFAQNPGKITEPAYNPSDPIAVNPVLDPPPSDGYITQSGSNFIANDIDESELQLYPVPVFMKEPNADPAIGPNHSFNDLVDTETGKESLLWGYIDGNLIFRFRTGKLSPNSKTYTVLIDSDLKYGNTGENADPTANCG